MSVSRRGFLKASAAAAAAASMGTGCRSAGGGPGGEKAREDSLDAALAQARSLGASHVDVRIVRTATQSIATREDRVTRVTDEESAGMNVRAIVAGQVGFAASPLVSPEVGRALARRAIEVAREAGPARVEPFEPCKAPRTSAVWASPCKIDPLSVPLEKRAAVCLEANARALAVKGVRYASSSLTFVREERMLATSEGSRILQTIVRGLPAAAATAVWPSGGDFETVSWEDPAQGGYEILDRCAFAGLGQTLGERAVRSLAGKPVEPGRYDLILMPSHLWLTIHESIGHPTELDRARGLEANYFGTSHLTLDKRGKFRFASPAVNVVADRTQVSALATTGYDDEGVPASRWPIIEKGIFVDYQTTREQAAWIGQDASHGCLYGQGYWGLPFQRMPNVSLEPGRTPLSPEELIAGTDHGIVMELDASFSIDQQRLNFQFTSGLAREVTGGKLGDDLRHCGYQANAVEFWNACDAIADERFYEIHGSFFDGKGQPGQSNPVSHGSAPARFRSIPVLRTRAGKEA